MNRIIYWLRGRRIRLSIAIRYYVVDRALRRIAEPTMTDILRGSACVATDPSEVLKCIFSPLGEEILIRLASDFAVVKQQLRSRYELADQLRLAYPVDWAIEEQGSFMLYCLVRVLKPQTIVETGVANGHSSFVMLSALKTNGQGKLVSVDISNDVGRLVAAEDGKMWDLRLLSRPGASDELRVILQSTAPIDLFIHDSEHLYAWQMTEYQAAATVLSRDGILASDDIDLSYAFWDFCRERGLKPVVLLDQRKALGLVRLTERTARM